MLSNKTIWICGHRKSGTTLLSNLLDNHPEISTYGSDLKLIYAVYDVFHKLDRAKVHDRIVKLFLDDRRETQRLNSSHIHRILESCNISNKEDVFIIIERLNALLSKHGRPLFKETSSEMYLNSICSSTSGTQFLHMVRDPRDNYAAILAGVSNYYSCLGEDQFAALSSVINRVNFGFEALKMNQKIYEEYHTVKFETLVEHPTSTMQSICAVLELEYLPDLLIPTKSGQRYEGNSHDGKAFNSVSSENVNRWPERISELEAQIIEATCEKMMDYFEYQSLFTTKEKSSALEYFYGNYNQRYFYFDKLGEV